MSLLKANFLTLSCSQNLGQNTKSANNKESFCLGISACSKENINARISNAKPSSDKVKLSSTSPSTNSNSLSSLPNNGLKDDEVLTLNMRLKKSLSEANAYNRYLKRQLEKEEETLSAFSQDLNSLEKKIKELTEIANKAASEGVNKNKRIEGKDFNTYLASKLNEIYEDVKNKAEEAKNLQVQEVPIVWLGMAEDVTIMGSFDGWTRGKQMSPEATGSFTKFTTTLTLRPGRYLVKFLVDGVWQIAPGWDTEGEGLMMNNVLVIESESNFTYF